MKTKVASVKVGKKITRGSWDLFFAAYCSAEWIPLVNLYKREQFFKAGDRIFNEGDRADGIYLLTSGKVKVVSQYDKTHERILRLASEGKILGHRAIGQAVFPISAVALTDGSAIFIPKDIFIKLLKTNPDFSVFMINFIAAELHDSEERMKNMIHHDVKMRIADILCMLVDAFGYDKSEKNKLDFTLSRKDFANIAGTTYETVIRILFQLQEMGLIKLDKKTIVVKKESELRKLAGQKI